MTDDVSISGAQLLSTNKMASIAEACQYFHMLVCRFWLLLGQIALNLYPDLRKMTIETT